MVVYLICSKDYPTPSNAVTPSELILPVNIGKLLEGIVVKPARSDTVVVPVLSARKNIDLHLTSNVAIVVEPAACDCITK
jgi:hypothetical protein